MRVGEVVNGRGGGLATGDRAGGRLLALVRTVHQDLVGVGGTGRLDAADLTRVAIAERVRRFDPLLPSGDVAAVVDGVLAHAGGLGPLDPFIEDAAVGEVMVNGDGSVWLERDGRLESTPMRLSAPEVLAVAERVLAPLGLRADRRHPVADARLPDGSRVHVVVPPVAVDGPCLTIRRFRVRPVPLGEFSSPAVSDLLASLVQRRSNLVVSGGTGAGKTTLLNSLAASVHPGERVVTIEDTAELRLPGDHVVRLETRAGDRDGEVPVGMGVLVRTALRMRPDRIVVGEVRGAEALAMLAAMNTGHEGSMSTLHANSPPDALRRLEAMALDAASGLSLQAVRQHVAAAVDVIVQVARHPGGGSGRRVVAVDEVVVPSGASSGVLATRPLVVADEVVAVPRRWRRAAQGIGR